MNPEQLFVDMIITSWQLQVRNAGKLINELSDAQLLQQVAPGKNRGVYLLGHLIAIHDSLNELLEFGPRNHADLDEAFVRNPDNTKGDMPAISVLRQLWVKVHQELDNAFAGLAANEWFSKHSAVSAADFAKQPMRNKLNVLITRTTHLSYHVGQLKLLQ